MTLFNLNIILGISKFYWLWHFWILYCFTPWANWGNVFFTRRVFQHAVYITVYLFMQSITGIWLASPKGDGLLDVFRTFCIAFICVSEIAIGKFQRPQFISTISLWLLTKINRFLSLILFPRFYVYDCNNMEKGCNFPIHERIR